MDAELAKAMMLQQMNRNDPFMEILRENMSESSKSSRDARIAKKATDVNDVRKLLAAARAETPVDTKIVETYEKLLDLIVQNV